MDHIVGEDLGEVVRREGALAPLRAARIVAQVASALDAAHARGLVHRDIKPGNVLIEGSGEEEHAYLTDFGLSKSAGSDSHLTKTGMWVGTLDYVAPEQIQDETVDARADVYALGCLLFHALTARPPFHRKTEVAKIWAHLSDPPPSVCEEREGIPAAFDDVIAQAMAKRREERYGRAGEFGRAALAAATPAAAEADSEVGPEASPEVQPPTAPSPRPTRPAASPPASTAPGARPTGTSRSPSRPSQAGSRRIGRRSDSIRLRCDVTARRLPPASRTLISPRGARMVAGGNPQRSPPRAKLCGAARVWPFARGPEFAWQPV